MPLTETEVSLLRRIAIRAVTEAFDVLEAAAKQTAIERAVPIRKEAELITLPPEKLAYSIKDASAALGISRGTPWKRTAEGKLKTFKLGARTLIRAEDLRSFLEECDR